MARAEGRQTYVPVDFAERLLWWRCSVRTQEHHLGCRAWTSSCDLHPQVLPRNACERAFAAADEALEPQNGHSRVGLQERLQPGRTSFDAARGSQGTMQEGQYRSRT